MKHLKKALFTLLILVMTMGMSISVFAAVKNGLVKVKYTNDNYVKDYHYYYYKSGKMVKNTWKSIKVKGKKYKFYFGKNGKAYKAGVQLDQSYVIKLSKIKGKKYAFDTQGHLVKSGIYMDEKEKIWVIKSNGTVDTAGTTEQRGKLSAFSNKEISKDLYDRVIATFGEPVKVERDTSCYIPWKADFGDDEGQFPFDVVILKYKYYEIQLHVRRKTEEYQYLGCNATVL